MELTTRDVVTTGAALLLGLTLAAGIVVAENAAGHPFTPVAPAAAEHARGAIAKAGL